MSAVQEAAANTMFRIANLYEQNCALKHGLPKVGGPDRVEIPRPEPPPQQPQPINITNNIPAAPAATDSPSPGLGAAADQQGQSLLRRAAPFLLTAAAAGLPSLLLLRQPAGETPTAPPAAVQPADSHKDGSLLQFLQDGGYHLPGGEQWAK